MAAQSFTAAPVNAAPFAEQGPVPSIFVGRSGDLLDRLPEQAANKLRTLRQRAEDAASLARSTMEAQEEMRTAKLRHGARVRQLMQPRSAGGYSLTADDPTVASEEKQLAKADAEFKRLAELSDVRHAQRGVLLQIENAIEKFFSRMPGGTAIAPWEGAAPQLKKGESVTDAIENKRRRLRELAADLHRVHSAPYPSSEAKAIMRAQIEALAERGAPNVLGLIENRTPIEFVTTQVRSQVFNTDPAAVAFTEGLPDTLALVAWLHRDVLVKALDKEIVDCSDDANALTDEQRQKQEGVILADVLATEREECALLEMALAQGINISYRDDTAPLAFLGLQLITAPAPASAPLNDGGWVNYLAGR